MLGLALKSNFIAVPGSLLLNMFPEPGVAHCVIEIRCKLLEGYDASNLSYIVNRIFVIHD